MKEFSLARFCLPLILLLGCQDLSSALLESASGDVEAAKSSLTLGFAPGDSPSWVTHDLTLPTSGPKGVSISWGSNNAAIGISGKVTRPPVGAGDAVVVLTARLTKGSQATQKTFSLTVLAQQVLYSAVYDPNGGTGTVVDSHSYGKGQTVVVLGGSSLTNPGSSFTGWNTLANGKGTAYHPGDSFEITTNVMLYAQWQVNQFTVTFDSQGGSTVAPLGALSGALISQPSNPTKTGSSFGGWYQDPGYNTVWNFETDHVIGDLTLHAKWVVNAYTVTFDARGGTDGLGGAYSQSVSADSGTTIGKPTAPVKVGHTFTGWTKDLQGTTAWNFASDTVTSNLTLYAQWSPITYTVTLNPQNGSPSSTVGVVFNNLLSTPPAPSKTGYSFVGWARDSLGSTAWNFGADKVVSDTTLYAVWTANLFTVTFDSQGGTPVTSASVAYQNLVPLPPAPTKTGYTFSGWYRESSGTTAWIFASDTVTAPVTLYAAWTANLFTVTFDSQGGSAVTSASVSYQNLVPVPPAPTKTGYTFSGWYRESSGTTAWVFGTDKVTSVVTLYAQWTANTYSVTFDSQGGSAVTGTTVAFNNLVTAPASPTSSGKVFSGWYKEAACTNAWNFSVDRVAGVTVLYAKWVTGFSGITLNYQMGTYAGVGNNVYAAWLENADHSFIQSIIICSKVKNHVLTGDALPFWYLSRRPVSTDVDAVTAATKANQDFSYRVVLKNPSLRKFTVYFETDRSFESNDWFNDQPALLYAASVDLDSGTVTYPLSPVGWTPNAETMPLTKPTTTAGTFNSEMRYITNLKSGTDFGAVDSRSATNMVKSVSVTLD